MACAAFSHSCGLSSGSRGTQGRGLTCSRSRLAGRPVVVKPTRTPPLPRVPRLGLGASPPLPLGPHSHTDPLRLRQAWDPTGADGARRGSLSAGPGQWGWARRSQELTPHRSRGQSWPLAPNKPGLLARLAGNNPSWDGAPVPVSPGHPPLVLRATSEPARPFSLGPAPAMRPQVQGVWSRCGPDRGDRLENGEPHPEPQG